MDGTDSTIGGPGPGDPDWEAWADAVLEGTDFDPELGKAMARDAVRVNEGDLARSTFYDRYHEVVQDEFGVDRRPADDLVDLPETGDDHDSTDAPLPHVPDTGATDEEPENRTRRTVLKAMAGTAAAAAALPGCLSADGPGSAFVGDSEDAIAAAQTSEDPSDTQLGMVIDLERCHGALDCMKACKRENNTAVGVHWNYVFRYADDGEGKADQYMPRPCQHCSRPTCTYVCPTEARHKRESDGIVLTDYDQCVGCRYCQVSCPYGVNFFGWGEPSDPEGFDYPREDKNGDRVAGNPPGGVMGKCTFCVQRQDSGDPDLEGTTACAEACPWNTISFGNLNDPEDDPQQHLKEKEGSHTFHLLESVGNEPSIIYVGFEPSINAESGESTATTFDELGFVDYRREVLDDRAPTHKSTNETEAESDD